ncbi:MAG: hypothetical protein ACYT04_53480 [Nostoc sp.]
MSAAFLNYTVGGINIWNTTPKQNPVLQEMLRGAMVIMVAVD